MSFREKTHWVALIVITCAFGWYFFRLHTVMPRGPGNIAASGGLLTIITIGIILAMTVIIGTIAAINPGDAHTKADERDRTIHWRGTHYAYYPIVLGTWLCIWMIFSGFGTPTILNTLLAVVVFAELVRIGTQIYLYRKGA
jgi:hypothetical protein